MDQRLDGNLQSEDSIIEKSMVYSSPFPDIQTPEVPLVDFVFANAPGMPASAAKALITASPATRGRLSRSPIGPAHRDVGILPTAMSGQFALMTSADIL